MIKYLFKKVANTILTCMYYTNDLHTIEKLFYLGLLVETTAYYYGYELN